MTPLQLIQLLCGIGFLLSAYATYVDYKVKHEAKYKAACDLSNRVSCTKAFESSYGSLLGVSNSLMGMGFYLFLFAFTRPELAAFFPFMAPYRDLGILILASISMLISIYLAYLLYFKVKTLCMVCNSIYVVNILILAFSYVNYDKF